MSLFEAKEHYVFHKRIESPRSRAQVPDRGGDRLTIVIHDDGARELYHFLRKSPDKVASVVTLSDSEARQVAGICQQNCSDG